MNALSATLAGLLLAAAAAPAPAQERLEIPENDGWVTDLAGLLDPAQERELERLMDSYQQGTSHEIALLTIPSLRGESLERFALEVGRAWKIGGREANDGALLLVVHQDRKMRIDVGRGLEGSLTDSICGRIIRNVIAPEFRRGRFPEGLKAGVVAIHEAIGGNYARIPSPSRPGGSGLAGLVPLLVIAFVVLAIASRKGRRRRSRWPWGGFGFPFPFPIGTGGGSWSGGGGSWGGGGFGGGGGGFRGFGGGGGFSGGGASGSW